MHAASFILDDNRYDDAPQGPTEQDDRDFMALRLRVLRSQLHTYGPSTVTSALLREARTLAQLLQAFRRMDRSSQKAGL